LAGTPTGELSDYGVPAVRSAAATLAPRLEKAVDPNPSVAAAFCARTDWAARVG